MTVSRKAVFFIRAYNDMDHFTPVIWQLATTTDLPISVVVRMGRAALEDYRMVFLRQFPTVTLHAIGDFIPEHDTDKGDSQPLLPRPSLLKRARRKLARWLNPQPPPEPRSRHEVDPDKVETMLDALFSGAQHGIVVFDWTTLSRFNVNFAQTVIESARRRGYANLSLPHGDSPY
ncbi:MAG: hypothetical protein H7Y11_08165, partial [Armatimonadetes bacterium]|nr:hypothetical protein [Anaerolineae bacterium]